MCPTYSDGTLSDGRYTVVLVRVVLADTMPVNTGTVIGQPVGDMNLDNVSLKICLSATSPSGV
jgi:hypothetical protein